MSSPHFLNTFVTLLLPLSCPYMNIRAIMNITPHPLLDSSVLSGNRKVILKLRRRLRIYHTSSKRNGDKFLILHNEINKHLPQYPHYSKTEYPGPYIPYT